MEDKFKEHMIKSLKEKLDWYTYKAPEDEFDYQEVQNILDMLQILDPVPMVTDWDAKKEYKKFKKRNPELFRGKRRYVILKTILITAAAIIFMFIVANVATIATTGKNIIDYIKTYKDGVSFVVTRIPDNIDANGNVDIIKFTSIEELQNYYPDILLPQGQPTNMSFTGGQSTRFSAQDNITVSWVNPEEDMRLTYQIYYYRTIGESKNVHMDLEYLYTETINGYDIEFYSNPDDSEDTIARFFLENCMYQIWVDCNAEKLVEFIESLE